MEPLRTEFGRTLLQNTTQAFRLQVLSASGIFFWVLNCGLGRESCWVEGPPEKTSLVLITVGTLQYCLVIHRASCLEG